MEQRKAWHRSNHLCREVGSVTLSKDKPGIDLTIYAERWAALLGTAIKLGIDLTIYAERWAALLGTEIKPGIGVREGRKHGENLLPAQNKLIIPQVLFT